MSIGIKVSKPNKQATSLASRDIIFDSEKATHPVYSINDYPADNNPIAFSHGLGFTPKVWINVLGATDTRLPIEDDVGEGIDYYVDSNSIIVNDDYSAARTVRIIVFAKDVKTV